ncbi:hypothetical protein [Pedobacter caeni]|uniref:NLI interacting factor-like phosphatase n=1 Tax=Pedobacter caeni TaxID=288992 RepID=A0A1M5GG12_9SPHI|nr:hypothetical protein [Pedobacter caeni]SHG02653.1 hypothetical protein SAMN04488522_104203 [Pedobacter caeni]
MKRLFKHLYFGIFNRVFKLKFDRIIGDLDPLVPVYLVDIDNTLADTWPSLCGRVYGNERDRYRSLSVFLGMRKLIVHQRTMAKVIFISARSYLNYQVTKRWLESCGLGGCDLILVAKAADKMYYLKTLVSREITVVYIDDLSYNHEHGELKLYHEMILELKDLPVTYLGLEEIELINSNCEPNRV